MEPARVSSPQVDLTRYGLDKTPTLLILRCLGATRSARRGRRCPLQTRAPVGRAAGKLDAGRRWRPHPSQHGKRGWVSRPSVVLPSPPPPVGEDRALGGPHSVSWPVQRKNTGESNPHAVARRPRPPSTPLAARARSPLARQGRQGVDCRECRAMAPLDPP